MGEAMQQGAGTIERAIGAGLFFVGVVCIMATPLIFGGMLLYWLKSAQWPHWTLGALGFSPPQSAFLGLNKLCAWVYDQPLAFCSLVLGMLLIFGGAAISDRRPN